MDKISSGRVTWRLRVFGRADNEPVLVLDIYSAGKVLASKTVTRRDFSAPGKWQTFSLDFKGGKQALVFRTYWTGKADIEMDHITLKIGNQTP